MILIKQSKNQYLTHYIPAAIIALVAPMGYLAPLGEWLLMAFLSLTLIIFTSIVFNKFHNNFH